MKPPAPFGTSRGSWPLTDYFFHAGFENWRDFSSPYDGEDRSEIRRFHHFSQQHLQESARERAWEMAVFGLVVAASAWPVIYMIVLVVKLFAANR